MKAIGIVFQIIILIQLQNVTFAQLIVKDSIIIHRKNSSIPTFEIITNKKNLIIAESMHGSNRVIGDYNFTFYDSLFKKKQEVYWKVNKKYNWWAYGTNDNEIILSCQHKSKLQNFKFSILNSNCNKIQEYDIETPVYLDVKDIFLLKNVVFLWGLNVYERDVVLACFYKEKKIILLEKITYSNTKIMNIWEDKNNDLLYIIKSDKQKPSYNINVITGNGKLIKSKTIHTNKTLLNAKILESKNNVYVGGMYTENKKKHSQGVYIYKWNNHEENIKFISYLKLKNFFLYLNNKYEKRYRKRQAKRKLLGKKIKYSISADVIDIKNENKLFHLIGQCYHEKKSDNKKNYNDINSFNSTYFANLERTVYLSKEVETVKVYNHAFSITFDEKLNIIDDASIGLNGIKSIGIEKKYVTYDNDITKQSLYRIKNNNISYTTFQKNTTSKPSPLKKSEQIYTIKGFKINEIYSWYDDYFIVSGMPKKTKYNDENGKVKIQLYMMKSQ